MGSRLTALLEPTVSGLGYELLGIEHQRSSGSQLIRLFIDQESGITADDCERVSRQVGDVLDVEGAVSGEYMLEVSSPGLGRPLFTLQQHTRFIGQIISLQLRALVDGRRRLKGELLDVTRDALVVLVDDKRFHVPFQSVERSKLIHDWTRG